MGYKCTEVQTEAGELERSEAQTQFENFAHYTYLSTLM